LGGGYPLAEALVRILVVDDFEPWRSFLRSFLRHHAAFQIICEASDGLEAVEKSRELLPDLILLDVGLPTLNGIEAAKQIRKVSPRSKIVFLSGNTVPEIVREALRVGGCGYVVKSDAGGDLVAALNAAIANKQFVGRRFLADGILDAAAD
jgi:DNA-binding NarL/FixJ family response regulator